MFDVHFYDRRDGTRKVLPQTFEWNQFWWEDGNASCDCNRSSFMYPDEPDKHIEVCTGYNLIVIEKVVVAGQVEYEESKTEQLAPRVVAVVEVREHLGRLYSLSNEVRDENALPAQLKTLTTKVDALAAFEDTAKMVDSLRHTIAVGNSIVACEANPDDPLDLRAAWEEVTDSFDDFDEMTLSVTKEL